MGGYGYIFVIFVSGALSLTTMDLPKCKPDTCPPTATCKEANGYIYCDCPKGKVGQNCTEDDPCMPNPNCPKGFLCYGPCDPNVVCTGATGQSHCRGCVAGYTGLNCTEDVNECTEFPGVCENNGTCENTFGDFKCFCTEGWTGKECRCRKGTGCDVAEIIEDNRSKDVKTTTPSSANSPVSSVSWKRLLLLFLCLLLR